MKRLTLIPLLALTSLLTSCSTYPRLLNFPFDRGGRGLNSPADELHPNISGRFIVFASDRFGRQDIYLFDGKTRQPIDVPGLNSLDAIAANPSITQDGRYIVFAGTREGRTDVYLYDRQTRQLQNFTDNLNAEIRNPTISADGSTIAFESSANGQWDILVYERSGKPLDIPIAPR
ncbi:TolB family protein [Oxynema aestuarii]|uniref:TolB family protein n=1 Tax=Oxynema aestuarii AP17 TaxID=2064643 RepID=A0A6H1TTY4_9CYAN|nr:TolB family protein [Oxynema aestuarii]QIZ70011.1 TolB family protein [Oxynema aestuarii AP17]RMH75675.1 MAG: Tol biopolymer transporter periplasmic protein [Cyanobacteria bacterium J007]